MTRTRINPIAAAFAAVAAFTMVACGTPSAANETVTLTPAASESTGSLDSVLEETAAAGSGTTDIDALPSKDAAPGLRDGALDDTISVLNGDGSRIDKLMSASTLDVNAFLKDQGKELDGLRLESWSGEGIQNGLCRTGAEIVVGACLKTTFLAWNRAKTQEVVDTYGDLAAPFMAAQAMGVIVNNNAGDPYAFVNSACVVGAYGAYVAASESYRFASDAESSAQALRGVLESVNPPDRNGFIDLAVSALNGYLKGTPSPCAVI